MKKIIGLVIASILFSNTVSAASDDDSATPAKAGCMVGISTSTSSYFVNIAYIRVVQVKTDKEYPTLYISLASNYMTGLTSIEIRYETHANAIIAMKDLAFRINTCK